MIYKLKLIIIIEFRMLRIVLMFIYIFMYLKDFNKIKI